MIEPESVINFGWNSWGKDIINSSQTLKKDFIMEYHSLILSLLAQSLLSEDRVKTEFAIKNHFVCWLWSASIAQPSFPNHFGKVLMNWWSLEKEIHLLVLTIAMAQWRISALANIRYIMRHMFRQQPMMIWPWIAKENFSNWCPCSNQRCQSATLYIRRFERFV